MIEYDFQIFKLETQAKFKRDAEKIEELEQKVDDLFDLCEKFVHCFELAYREKLQDRERFANSPKLEM